MNLSKLKIPHPKFNKINIVKKNNFLFPPTILKSMNDIEKNTKKNKIKKSPRKSFVNLTMLPITHKLISKEDLMKDLKKIKYINKPLFKKLSTILNEEERIIKTDFNKTNNFSFNFNIFEKENKNKKKLLHSLSYNKTQDISYLDRYEEIIKDKHSNEKKAQKYIESINTTLQNKKLIQNDINQDLYNFCKKKNAKRLNNSIEIDAKISILNSLRLKNKLIRSNSEKNHESKIDIELKLKEGEEKEKKLEKEIEETIKKNKEEEEKNLDLEIQYIQNSNQIHHEIKELEKELNDNIESGINYYLEILKKGNDTRKSGLSWVVRRLLKLNYEPKKEDFPYYFDEKMSKFIIEIAKKQLDKNSLISKYKYHQNNFLKGIKRNSQFVIKNDDVKSNKNSIDKYVMKKVGELLDKHVEFFATTTPNFNKIDIHEHKSKTTFSFNGHYGNSILTLHKNFLNPPKVKEFNLIMEIKKKIDEYDKELTNIDNQMYEYIQKKELKDYRNLEQNVIKALFGVQTKYKINPQF